MHPKLETIRNLLARAEHPETPLEESDTAFLMANKMMAKYGIDSAMLAAKQSTETTPTHKVYDITGDYAVDQCNLWHIIAKFNRCSGIRLRNRAAQYDEYGNYKPSRSYQMDISGYSQDIEIVEMLFTSLHLQLANRLQHVEAVRAASGAILVTTKSARCQYFSGFTSSIRERLEAAETTARHDARNEHGHSTELVLMDREKKITTYVNDRYPQQKKVRTKRVQGRHYAAGRDFGKSANLHDTQGVGGDNRGELG